MLTRQDGITGKSNLPSILIFLLSYGNRIGCVFHSDFQDRLQSPGGPLVIFEVTMICTVLGLIGGLSARMLKRGEPRKGNNRPRLL